LVQKNQKLKVVSHEKKKYTQQGTIIYVQFSSRYKISQCVSILIGSILSVQEVTLAIYT